MRRVPLENACALHEDVLCRQMGHSILGLVYQLVQLITYGGMRGLCLHAGETIIVALATGARSGAGVGVALAMGAKVVTTGRNEEALWKLQARFPGGRVGVRGAHGG